MESAATWRGLNSIASITVVNNVASLVSVGYICIDHFLPLAELYFSHDAFSHGLIIQLMDHSFRIEVTRYVYYSSTLSLTNHC